MRHCKPIHICFVAVFVLICGICHATDYDKTFKPGWHLITLPCQPGDDDPAAVFAPPFEDVVGMVDGKLVPAYEMEAIEAGMAFWLHFASETTVTVSGAALETENYQVSLADDWNMFGSPYEMSLWGQATLGGESISSSDKVETSLYYYDATQSKYIAATVLEPWKGYFIRLDTTAEVTLQIENAGTIATLPEPSNISAEPCTYGKHTLLCVTWDIPDTEGTGYNIFVYDTPQTFQLPYNGNRSVAKNRYTVGGLTPGKEYGIEITNVVDSNGEVIVESAHSSRSLKDTVASAGNVAVVSFRALSETQTSAGRVAYRTDGSVEEGAYIVAYASATLKTDGGTVAATGTTDEFGWAEFSSIEPGSYQLDVSHKMDPENDEDDIKVHQPYIVLVAGQSLDLGDLTLAETGTIQGVVELSGMTNYIDTRVGIPGTSFFAWTDRDGNYTIFYVPPGTWTIRAVHDGFAPKEVEDITVESKSVKNVPKLTLDPSENGIISGYINLSGQSIHSGARVKIDVDNKQLVDFEIDITDDTGYFRESDLDPGGYTIIATYDGFVSYSTHVVIFQDIEKDLGQMRLLTHQEDLGSYTITPGLPICGSCLMTSAFVADLDGDGDPDVIAREGAVSMGEDAELVYLNDGTGQFTQSDYKETPSSRHHEYGADIDNDGDIDIVSDTVRVNDGSGGFSTSISGVNGTYAADVNNDGLMDVISQDDVYVNSGGGSFSPLGLSSSFADGTFAKIVIAADIDGDSDMDIISSDSIWENDGALGFTDTGHMLKGIGVEETTMTLQALDVDDDEDIDIIQSDHNDIYVWSNDGAGSFSPTTYSSGGDWYHSFFSADFDRDGYYDIVIGKDFWASERMMLNDGAGGFETPIPIEGDDNCGTYVFYPADFDSDGDLDILKAGISFDIECTYYLSRNSISGNFPPGVPLNLSSDESDILYWEPEEDKETPQTSLTYNLAVSLTPGVVENTDFTAFFGNLGHTTSWHMKNLCPGETYYWSVQSVDTGLEASDWAGEMSFSVPGSELSSISVTPDTGVSVVAGETQPFSAECTYVDMSTSDCSSGGLWGNTNSAAGGISSGGLFTAEMLYADDTTTISKTICGVESNPVDVTITGLDDVTPPEDIETVNDGDGADVDEQSKTIFMAANWTASSDLESDIAGYWYSVGTTSGASDTISWTDNGTDISVEEWGLSLSVGQTYYFTVKAQNGNGLFGNSTTSDGITISLPKEIIILLGDSVDEYEFYYEDAVSAAGFTYDTYSIYEIGEPPASLLAGYMTVILASDEIGYTTMNSLETYLDAGGQLFITGQDIGYYHGSDPFYSDYLHADYIEDDTAVHSLSGVAANPITDGLVFEISGGDGADNQSYPSEIDPLAPATTILTYDTGSPTSSGSGGIMVDTGIYRVVYLSFGFEAISASATRTALMQNTIDWLQGN